MRAIAPLLLALAACAPLPDGGPRQLSAEGIRPGVGAARGFAAARPPLGTPITYAIRTPLRDAPNEMQVVLQPRDGGYTRAETVRIPESSAVQANIIAAMVRQRDGRAAEVVGTDVVLRARDELDPLGRCISSDRGGIRIGWDPHDCRATLGECRTVRHDPDGRTNHLIVTTTEADGIWREQVRLDPARDPQGKTTLLEEAFYSLDENGLLIDMNRLDHERDLGNYQEIRRVQ